MTRNWNDIKWIFEPDGSLRDIYVQDVTISDWEKTIDLLNLNYNLTFGPQDNGEAITQIDKLYIVNCLTSQSNEIAIKSASIDLQGILVKCHFFLLDQIEFDIDPNSIMSIHDFEKIENFMISISMVLKTQVTLTAENRPEFPLIKIDTEKGINKVLTLKEADRLSNQQNSLLTKLSILKTKIKMKFFRKTFERQVLKSANGVYGSTSKHKNVW